MTAVTVAMRRHLLHSSMIMLLTLLPISMLQAQPVAAPAAEEEKPAAEDSWRDIIRATPYADSQGVAGNLRSIRTWVLFSESYCSEPERHLLFDQHFRFIGYIDDADSSADTIMHLNNTRQRLYEEGRVDAWTPGTLNGLGFPFALSCHQPFVNMDEAIQRLTSTDPEYAVWGTWDGISVGSIDAPVTLIELFDTVHAHRHAQGRFTFPEAVIPTFLGKVIIESGGQKDALSQDAAMGIMQLRPAVLDDCEIPEAFRRHRMAQVDCALRLMEQNHRNLQPVYQDTFGHLPDEKRDELYGLLLTQAWLIGVGRSIELLQDQTLGQATRYFAEHHERFSAEDIQVGMVFHNLGRRDIGLLSLYYVSDARIAQARLNAVR